MKDEWASHMAKTDLQLLLLTLDYGFNVASWHGPNLMGVLRGVSSTAARRRFPGRKCIGEQVLHAAYWKQCVLNKVIGPTPFPRRGSNWPTLPDAPALAAADALWKADLHLLRDLHARLRAGVANLSAVQLDAKLTRMIIGAAFHDIYHASQIKLLKRMLIKKQGRRVSPLR